MADGKGKKKNVRGTKGGPKQTPARTATTARR